MEFGKWFLFVVAKFLGMLFGISVIVAVWTSPLSISTRDCAIDPVPLCVSNPAPMGNILGVPTTNGNVRGMEGLAGFIIAMAYAIAVRPYSNASKMGGVLWGYGHIYRAVIIGGAYAAVHAGMGLFTGGSFNLFYWLSHVILINDTTNAGLYIWPFLVGVLIAFVLQALYYLVIGWLCNERRRQLQCKGI
jgi:hypothetical protein